MPVKRFSISANTIPVKGFSRPANTMPVKGFSRSAILVQAWPSVGLYPMSICAFDNLTKKEIENIQNDGSRGRHFCFC
jgi:hypothetical protein